MEGREEKGQESKNAEEGKWKGVNRRKGNWKDRACSHFSAAINGTSAQNRLFSVIISYNILKMCVNTLKK